MYAPKGLVLSLRAGYERAQPLDIAHFRRCTMLPSADPTITGQTCTDEHYQRSAPGLQHSGYVRLAGTYYPSDAILSQYLSATELRFNLESLATEAASFDVHLLLFAKGYHVGGGSVRVGIGATVKAALASPPGTDYHRGDVYDYSLFGITGTSFRIMTAQCFETFPEAIAAATNGRVQLPSSATPETVDKETLNGNAATSNSTFVIGIEFVDAGFHGESLTITSGVTCNGFDIWISSMPGGWNDVISSAEAFSDCNHSIHYEHVNFGGASVDCGTGCSYIGDAMNDRTSSILWTN